MDDKLMIDTVVAGIMDRLDEMDMSGTGEVMTENRCYWEETDIAWETSCGELFVFTVDGPKENKFKFCPYCGARLMIPVIVTDEE